jgi:hypothetical protein
MAVREQLRAILRQVVVHPKMVTDPHLAQGQALGLGAPILVVGPVKMLHAISCSVHANI